MISQVAVVEMLLNTSTNARCPAAPCTVPGMTRMSLVHGGVDTWVAVAGLEAVGLGAGEVVDGAVLEEVADPDEVSVGLGVADVLCVPDPEVELVHPASAAPAIRALTASCALRRIIGLSLSRNPDVFVPVIMEEIGRGREIPVLGVCVNTFRRQSRSGLGGMGW